MYKNSAPTLRAILLPVTIHLEAWGQAQLLFFLIDYKIFHGFSSLSDEILPTLIGTHYLAKNWCRGFI